MDVSLTFVKFMMSDATRFVDPALGFSMGWTYWCKYAVVTYNPAFCSKLTCTDLISIFTHSVCDLLTI